MGTEKNNIFSSYTYSEGRTGGGQFVEFTCSCGDANIKEVKEFLRTKIRTIDIPNTGRVSIGHGAYGQYTRYRVVQHDYAGGGPNEGGAWGYTEVLEIKNPPEGRCGIVINECNNRESAFTEWDTLENARNAFMKYRCRHDQAERFPKLLGFKRQVVCNTLTPWFYAIGDEELIGDFTFPEGFQDDPVYRFGKKFVVYDNSIPMIKICFGSRVIKRKSDLYPYNEYYQRLVYWDDGTIWDGILGGCSNSPRPFEESEMWIGEAIQQFHQLLAGKKTDFSINFTNGNKFSGRVVMVNKKVSCAEGAYYLVCNIKGEKKVMEGWVKDFKPTQECPDVVQYVTKRFLREGREVERIEIKKSKINKKGKKWSGVFFNPAK